MSATRTRSEPMLVWSLVGSNQRRQPGLARESLRAALCRFTGDIRARLEHRPGRPPLVVGHADVAVSLARGSGVAMGVVARCDALGMDVEDMDALEHTHGLAGAIGAPTHATGVEILQTWTRKEALAKAMGIGLPDDVRTLAVPAEPIEPGRWLRVDGWLWVGCPCEDGCVASLVVREPGPDQAGRASITERERSETGGRSWSIEVRP